jgi:hypothetical protein
MTTFFISKQFGSAKCLFQISHIPSRFFRISGFVIFRSILLKPFIDFKVNFINPLAQGANVLAHRVESKNDVLFYPQKAFAENEFNI